MCGGGDAARRNVDGGSEGVRHDACREMAWLSGRIARGWGLGRWLRGGTKDENLSNYIKGTVGLCMILLDKDCLLYRTI